MALEWLGFETHVVSNVLSGVFVIQESLLTKFIENISDAFIADDFKISIFQDYTTEDALRLLENAIDDLKSKCMYICPQCSLEVDDKSVFCEHCLRWLHEICAGVKITKKLSQRTDPWFCFQCIKNFD